MASITQELKRPLGKRASPGSTWNTAWTAPAPVEIPTPTWKRSTGPHLVNLAQAGWPNSVQVKHPSALIHRRKGDPGSHRRPRRHPPEQARRDFANADEQEAWYTPPPPRRPCIDESRYCRILCLQEFRNSDKAVTTACTCSAVP